MFDVERHLTPGDGFHVAELDTAEGPVKVGAMICYDREFPESARILMLQGAEKSEARASLLSYSNSQAILPRPPADCNPPAKIFPGFRLEGTGFRAG